MGMLGFAQLVFITLVKAIAVLFHECIYVLRRAVLLFRVIRQRSARK